MTRGSIIKFLKKLAASHSSERARSPPNENYIKVLTRERRRHVSGDLITALLSDVIIHKLCDVN